MKKNVFLVSWEIERQSERRSETETDRDRWAKKREKIQQIEEYCSNAPLKSTRNSLVKRNRRCTYSFTIIRNGLGIFSNRTTSYLAVQLLDRYLFIDCVCRRRSQRNMSVVWHVWWHAVGALDYFYLAQRCHRFDILCKLLRLRIRHSPCAIV